MHHCIWRGPTRRPQQLQSCVLHFPQCAVQPLGTLYAVVPRELLQQFPFARCKAELRVLFHFGTLSQMAGDSNRRMQGEAMSRRSSGGWGQRTRQTPGDPATHHYMPLAGCSHTSLVALRRLRP